ncbi:MAG: hypothetical protein LBG76_05605 [Treponema sp.]|jgi:sec-independent protein translocase protein TatB|nr:hypothetical protein [Treponema sp.]
MFGIGLSEILIVCLVIIIFIRPNDLPKFLRTMGRLYGKARKIYRELASMKDQIIREIDTGSEVVPNVPLSPPLIAPPDPAQAAQPDSAQSAAQSAPPEPEAPPPP